MLGDSTEDVVNRAITEVLTEEFGAEKADCVDLTNFRADLRLSDVEVDELIAALELKLDVELTNFDDGNDVETFSDLVTLFVPLVREMRHRNIEGLIMDLQAIDRK